jgi:DNA-binding GntR family transcriptional regulator
MDIGPLPPGEEGDETLADRVAEHLTRAILSGALATGARVSEPKLANQLGVSRGPLREALRRLQERMLLSHTPRQGVRVIVPTPGLLVEVFAIREALEGLAAREAARHATDAEAVDLQAMITRHERMLAGTEGQDYQPATADRDFHVAIVGLARNGLLQTLLTRDYYPLLQLLRARHRLVEGRAMRALTEHRRIVEAIVERDPDLAEYLMRRHIAAARSACEDAL